MQDDIGSIANLLAEINGTPNPLANATIEQLTYEIKYLNNQQLLNYIEIGKRLIEAKKKIPYGHWGNWLENEIGYDQRFANRLMQVAEEIPDSSTLTNLTFSKALAMITYLPANERESYAEQPHEMPSGEIKTVTEMSSRELEAALKAKKVAEDIAAKAEAEAARLKTELVVERQATEAAREHSRDQSMELAKTKKLLEERPVVEVDKVPDDYKQIKTEQARITRTYSDLKRDYDQLVNQTQIIELELKAYQTGRVDEKMSVQVRTDIFFKTVQTFVDQVAPMAFLAKDFMHQSPDCRRKYTSAIEMIEKFCSDMRDNMIQPKAKEIIDAEVLP